MSHYRIFFYLWTNKQITLVFHSIVDPCYQCLSYQCFRFVSTTTNLKYLYSEQRTLYIYTITSNISQQNKIIATITNAKIPLISISSILFLSYLTLESDNLCMIGSNAIVSHKATIFACTSLVISVIFDSWNMMKLWIVLISLNFYFINCYIVDPGPVVKATEGKIWFLQMNIFLLKSFI